MANEAQITHWREQGGPGWVSGQDRMDRQLGPLGDLVRERLAPKPGEAVVDVGCGTGQTTLQLVDAVGPNGRVVGVDVSTPMLALARERARGRDNVSFLEADAQTHSFAPATFDALHSRFGVMFFDDPVAAFTNLGAAMRPGGRLSFVCWRPPELNLWMSEGVRVIASLIPPPPPPSPDAPGPYAFADSDRVRAILTSAGWSGIEIDPHDTTITVAANLDEAIVGLQEVGPTALLLREATADTRAEALDVLRAAFAPRIAGDGLHASAAVWIVHAVRR
jgi:SAM-dependent methyltransferase